MFIPKTSPHPIQVTYTKRRFFLPRNVNNNNLLKCLSDFLLKQNRNLLQQISKFTMWADLMFNLAFPSNWCGSSQHISLLWPNALSGFTSK